MDAKCSSQDHSAHKSAPFWPKWRGFPVANIDLSSLSNDDLDALERISEKLHAGNDQGGKERRVLRIQSAETDRSREAELEFCGSSPEGIIHWFDKYVWTFDPRLLGSKDEDGRSVSPYVPFVLWPKQRELIHFLWDRLEANEEFLLEKSRDTGATYVMAGFMLNRWLFSDGFKGTFGSRDLDLVDVAGDPDSIFEKMRIMLSACPNGCCPRATKRTSIRIPCA